MSWLAAYLALGAIIGFLAGLLGIGGGLTLVPLLAALFQAQALSADHIVHLSSSSVRAHHQLGSVDWALVRRLAPALLLGSFLATFVSGWLPQRALALGFAVVVFGGATQMLLGRKPAPGTGLPGRPVLLAIGVVVGVICGLASAGGAFLTVPLMLFAAAARRLKLATVGLFQYLSPSLQLAIGVAIFGEPFDGQRLAGFVLIWTGLLVYTAHSLALSRRAGA